MPSLDRRDPNPLLDNAPGSNCHGYSLAYWLGRVASGCFPSGAASRWFILVRGLGGCPAELSQCALGKQTEVAELLEAALP